MPLLINLCIFYMLSQDLFFNPLQVANVVVSESPSSSDGKGMELEDLIESLASNPFLARKQIPRTPENLSEFKVGVCNCEVVECKGTDNIGT